MAASSQQEQLYILLNGSPQNVYRYGFGTAKPAATTQVPNGQYAMFVSANQYVITAGPPGENVYGPNGTHTTITLSNDPAGEHDTWMSTDNTVLGLISYDANAGVRRIVEYRAPFTTPFVSSRDAYLDDTATPYKIYALNRDGSQALGIEGSLSNSPVVTDIPSGVSKAFNTGEFNSVYLAFDGAHSWLYALAYNSNTGDALHPSRIVMFDTVHSTSLGYLNLTGRAVTNGVPMAVNQTTGDLYVNEGNKVYVYNVPTCHCAAVQRIVTPKVPAPPNGNVFNVVIDPQNKHLLLYISPLDSPQAPWSTEVFDVNPITGALQGTYRPSTSSSVGIQSVVAQ